MKDSLPAGKPLQAILIDSILSRPDDESTGQSINTQSKNYNFCLKLFAREKDVLFELLICLGEESSPESVLLPSLLSSGSGKTKPFRMRAQKNVNACPRKVWQTIWDMSTDLDCSKVMMDDIKDLSLLEDIDQDTVIVHR